MNLQTVKRIVLSKQPGTFSSILYEKQLPIRKAFANSVVVTKRSSGTVRFGVEYDNIAKVKALRELSELPDVNAGLTWGTWEHYPYFIEHRGNHFLRCNLVNGSKFNVEYFMNGRRATKEEVAPFCLASAFKEHAATMTVFSINIDNILSIR